MIIKVAGYYLEYSVGIREPLSDPRTLEEFKAFYKEEYGRQGMAELEERLKRVEEFGTSGYLLESWQDTINCNMSKDDPKYVAPEKFEAAVKNMRYLYEMRQAEKEVEACSVVPQELLDAARELADTMNEQRASETNIRKFTPPVEKVTYAKNKESPFSNFDGLFKELFQKYKK